MTIPEATKQWLIESDIPFVRYNAAQLFQPGTEVYSELQHDPFIKETISHLKGWNDEILKQHNKADLLMHRLAMLADLGVKKEHDGMPRVIDMIVKQCTTDGIPLSAIQIPKMFGGTNIPSLEWIVCDYPLILYALLKLGVDNQVTSGAVAQLEKLVDENGLRCKGSLPAFRGPGRKDDPCPIVNVFAARVFSINEKMMKSNAAKCVVEMLLHHWEKQKEKKYYLFGIGTDFKKLKFPLVWYNILHVLEPLSCYPHVRNDVRFQEMVHSLASKADDRIRFSPESMYQVYKGRDFANKKELSPTITLISLRILKRAGYCFTK